jgi:hypothetical protein
MGIDIGPTEGKDSREEDHDIDVLSQIVSALKPLSQQDRKRVIDTVATFFGIDSSEAPARATGAVESVPPSVGSPVVRFSEDLSLSPKEFIVEKQPETDVERVACLAYYLTHYRDSPYFKTLEISRLNTEAAQRKLANSTWAVDNAAKQGYLVDVARGQRQLSAFGEQYVRALPDREAARGLRARVRAKRRIRRKTKGSQAEG